MTRQIVWSAGQLRLRRAAASTYEDVDDLVATEHAHHAPADELLRLEVRVGLDEREDEDDVVEDGGRDEGEGEDGGGGVQIADVVAGNWKRKVNC